jgi:hypothetical protein
MRSNEPPVLAKWILENIRFENSNEALVDDLLETFRSQSRSKAWYRRQVLAAVSAGFLDELRNHWILALRAMAIGLGVSYLAQMLGHGFFVRLHHTLNLEINPYLAWIIVSVFCGAVSARSVGLSHRKHQSAMLLVSVGSLLVWESIARFYISPFNLEHLPFVFLFYPSVLLGAFAAGFVLNLAPRSKTQPPVR